jgi:hypothetical protein
MPFTNLAEKMESEIDEIVREEIEHRLNEIDRLQTEVDRILYNKNPLVRFFQLGKARRLHEQAQKLLDGFFTYPLTK